MKKVLSMRGKRKPVYRLLAVVLCICITMTQTSIVSAEDSREAALLNSRESDSGSISVYGAADSMDASGDEPAGDDGTPDDGTKGSQENTGNGTDAGEEAGTGVDPGAGTGVDTGAGTEADKGADTSNDGNTAANDSDTSGDGTEDKADQTENKNEASENLDLYYKDGRICIYNYKQILLIGSGQQVYTGDIEENSDQGDVGDVVRTENDVLTYGLDQKYYLMNDIEMDTSSLWEFPDAFTGTIEPYESREETGVYDEAADTIYIYNRYQLELMLSEDAEKELVMSEDWTAEKVGMGQPLVLEDGSKLTYGTSHKYVLASDFTSATPELLSHKVMTLADDGSYEGRDFAGQVIKKIGDIEYILIGNREQLQAIGSGAVVYTAVYQASQLTLVSQWEVDKDSSGNPIMLYGGDADLAASQNGKKEYTFGKPDKAGSNGLRITGRCGVNQTTGEIDPNLDIEEASGHKYDADENYIIFRDIDLENKDWTPLMFSGTIEGRLNMVEESAVTISNVYVTQSGDLDNSKTSGIGFFGSIMNTSKNTIGISDQAVSVKNMTLRNVSVTNTSTKIKNNTGLISGLLEILGAILGTLLGPFGDAIDSLLNPSKNVD